MCDFARLVVETEGELERRLAAFQPKNLFSRILRQVRTRDSKRAALHRAGAVVEREVGEAFFDFQAIDGRSKDGLCGGIVPRANQCRDASRGLLDAFLRDELFLPMDVLHERWFFG